VLRFAGTLKAEERRVKLASRTLKRKKRSGSARSPGSNARTRATYIKKNNGEGDSTAMRWGSEGKGADPEGEGSHKKRSPDDVSSLNIVIYKKQNEKGHARTQGE